MSGSLIDGMHQEVIGLLKLYTPKVKKQWVLPILIYIPDRLSICSMLEVECLSTRMT